jgi:histidinol-phosphatase
VDHVCHSTRVALANDPDGWPEDLAFAHELARAASTIALNYFGSCSSSIKADGTPVGEADLAVDQALTDLIRAAYPEDAILSEESQPIGESHRRWILDPVDGTVFFLAGEDRWGTHVALEENGEIVLGIVTRPMLGEVWWALRGAGSWRGTLRVDQTTEPTRLHVSEIDRLYQSRVTVWPVEQNNALVAKVKESATWVEPDAQCVLRLSEGDFEAVCTFDGGPWDHAPAVVLVEEAGGRFCDPDGGRRLDLRGAFYTNGRIDGELRGLMQRS